MSIARRTVVVPDRIALQRVRTELALEGVVGAQVMTLPHLISRLAGGFLRPASTRDIRQALQNGYPRDTIGSLQNIAELPGFIPAVAQTLHQAWQANLNLSEIASTTDSGSRWHELRVLESAVRSNLPSEALIPSELVAHALEGVEHAAKTLGIVQLERVTEVPRVYQPVLEALAQQVEVTWIHPVDGPQWKPKHVQIRPRHEHEGSGDRAQRLSTSSHPTSREELRAALRWARGLLLDGVAPADIAIAAPNPEPYDSALHALLEGSDLPIHSAHGVPFIRTPEGQLLASLADAMANGPSRARLDRSIQAGHAAQQPGFLSMPIDWASDLDPVLVLADPDDWPEEPPKRVSSAVWTNLLSLRDALIDAKEDPGSISEAWLDQDLAVTWLELVEAGPNGTLLERITEHRIDDASELLGSILWSPLETLVGSPRSYTRVLGLNSGAWPRIQREDPLLPERILQGRTLFEKPQSEIDRDTFRVIQYEAHHALHLSYPRLGHDRGEQRPSPLLSDVGEPETMGFDAHAPTPISERDRRRQRPNERRTVPHVQRAVASHVARGSSDVTRYDGLLDTSGSVGEVLEEMLAAPISVTRLQTLINDPFGFLSSVILAWNEPPIDEQPLQLDNLTLGSLVHQAIETTHRRFVKRNGVNSPLAPDDDLIQRAVTDVCSNWAATNPTPPDALWMGYQRRIERYTRRAFDSDVAAGGPFRSYPEVRFNAPRYGQSDALDGQWDGTAPVHIGGGTVSGVIDRLDLAPDGSYVRVTDFKTGAPKSENELGRSREVQRVAYAAAVRQRLGNDVEVDALLHYVRNGKMVILPADDMDRAIAQLNATTQAARDRLQAGRTVPGGAVSTPRSSIHLAYPANVGLYLERKAEAFARLHAPVDEAWNAWSKEDEEKA